MTRTLALVAVLAAALATPAGAPVPAPVRLVVPVADVAAAPVPPVAEPDPVPVALPSPSAVPTAVPAPPAPTPSVGRGRPWFRTPRAAMRYLVAAYNDHDYRALARVTTPTGRSALIAMRQYAPSLALTSCVRLAAGDYDCEFTHTLAKPSPGHRHGYATFRVAPAVRHGWYMTVLEECGDAA